MTLRQSFAACLCLLAFPLPVTLAAEPATVEIRGSVRTASDGIAVAGATIVAVHIDTKLVFRSSPTSEKGVFTLPNLPFGYFDLAVETATGLYLANRVFSAPAGEKFTVCFAVGPPQAEDTAWWSASPNRRIPGLDRAPDGVARIIDCSARGVAAAPPGGVAAGRRTAARWVWPTAGAIGVVGLGLALSSGGGSSGDGDTSPSAR